MAYLEAVYKMVVNTYKIKGMTFKKHHPFH
jgi:hypothetical protein